MSATLARPLTPPAGGDDPFRLWWSLPGEYVESPNTRRGGWSGVVRAQWDGAPCYIKRQRNHLCRTAAHPLGWPTASREHFYLERVRALGIPVPEVLYHDTRRTAEGVDAVLATRALAGFVPLSCQSALTPIRRSRLAQRLGRLLGLLHRARLQHGCLYDKHIMVRWHGDTPDIALLDLEKMRRRLTRRSAAEHDLRQLRRHQQVWNDEEWRKLETAHAAALSGRSGTTAPLR